MKSLSLVLLWVVLGLAASGAEVTGTWSGTLKITGPDGQTQDDTIRLILKQEGGKVTGTAGPSAAEQAPIVKGAVAGNRVTMEVPVPGGAMRFDVVLEGDRLQGEVTLSAGGQTMKAKMDAARAAVDGAAPGGPRRLACLADLLQGGAGRRQGFGGAFQVLNGLGARARIVGQDQSQNQVRPRKAGIQAEGAARGGDGFGQAMEPALRVGEIAELRRAGPGDCDGSREFGGSLLKAVRAQMLHGQIVVGIGILG